MFQPISTFDQFLTDYKSFLVLIMALYGILNHAIEFCCYFVIFYTIFKHDNTEAIKILKPSVIRQRNQTNAISLIGQVLGFVIKLWYLITIGFLAVPFNATTVREVSGIMKTLDFIAIPVVMILTTSNLRNFYKR
jgi:hypothetical protein